MTGCLRWLLVFSLVSVYPVWAQTSNESLREIKTMLSDGNREAAFACALTIPGESYRAARIGGRIPVVALRLLDTTEAGKHHPERLLIRGDLLLALGRKAAALACYQQYAAQLTAVVGYPVEIPAGKFADYWEKEFTLEHGWVFEMGPGSHRDNWLIRRFLALQAMPDAAREYERVWLLHQKLAGTRQLPPLSLQFGLDYAFFLSQNRQTDKALDLTRQVLLQIDLDRNPLSRRQAIVGFENLDPAIFKPKPPEEALAIRLFYRNQGMTRKECIRLGYGFLKVHDQEATLIAAARQLSETGTPVAQRLYARLLQLQGNEEGAFQAELTYVDALPINQRSKTYRRGLVFESFGHMPEALREFEACFQLPDDVPQLADEPEDMRSFEHVSSVRNQGSPKGFPQYDLVERLQRLSNSVGDSRRALSLRLAMVELRPELLWYDEGLTTLAASFKAAHREPEFTEWVKNYIAHGQDLAARMKLAFYRQDLPVYLQLLAEKSRPEKFDIYRFHSEIDDLLKERPAWAVPYLECLVKTHPENQWFHLELLIAQKKAKTPEVIQVMEKLLETQPGYLFSACRQGRYPFKNQFDLAYQLMCSYEQSQEQAKMLNLALRLVRGEAPFEPSQNYLESYPWSTNWGYGNAALAVAIQVLPFEDLNRLQSALENSVWKVPAAQLQRRLVLAGGKPAHLLKEPPKNVLQPVSAHTSVIVSYENVLSLCRDESRLYVGHSWGVAVRDFDGTLLRTIVLGESAAAMTVLNGALWIGTSSGVIRLDLQSFEPKRLRCNVEYQTAEKKTAAREFTSGNRSGNPTAGQQVSLGNVNVLAAQGDLLWIGTQGTLCTYHTRTTEIRVFLKEELGVAKAKSWVRFLFDGPYVWASSNEESIRYDSRSGRWEHPPKPHQKPVLVNELRDGKLWGMVEIQEKFEIRPCLIDRETMAVTIFPLEAAIRRFENREEPYYLFGTRNGKLILGNQEAGYELDPKSGKIRKLLVDAEHPLAYEPNLPFDVQGGRCWTQPDGTVVVKGKKNPPGGQRKMRADNWHMLELPTGNCFLGGQQWPVTGVEGSFVQELFESDPTAQAGGLWQVSPLNSGEVKRRRDSLSGDVVFAVAPNEKDKTVWLATDRGLAVMSSTGELLKTFTHDDGLPVDCVTRGDWNDDRFEFELDSDPLTRHGFFDAQTGVFRMREIQEDRPKTPSFRHTIGRESHESMPWLGGFLLGRQKIFGKTYLFGTRGIVVSDTEPETPSPVADLLVSLAPNQPVQWQGEAESLSIPEPVSVEQFAVLMQSHNPFVLMKAIEATSDLLGKGNSQFVTLAAPCLKHWYFSVCKKAIKTFGHVKLPIVTKTLLSIRSSPDQRVRALAVVALAQQGMIPDVQPFVEILTDGSSVGMDKEKVFGLLAPQADTRVFQFLLPYAADLNRDDWSEIFADLGRSLERHPEALPVLLNWKPVVDVRGDHYPIWAFHQVAGRILQPTGKTFLPALHRALASPNRVVRSNAARLCGAMNNPESIPFLIRALDLESGLARASIVWALGELKARESLPELVKLYTDARIDEQRQAGSGYRYAQQADWMRSEFQSLSSFENIGRDWDEFKQNALPKPVVPQEDELLLRPENIFEAIQKIGPEQVQAFYRALAGEEDFVSRLKAAELLCRATGPELSKNRLVLRSLLSDRALEVQVMAAVSLLLLGETEVQPLILAWLSVPRKSAFQLTLARLGRVTNPSQLDFVRARLKQLADSPALGDWDQQRIRELLKHQ